PVELDLFQVGKFSQPDLVGTFENGFGFADRQRQDIGAHRSEEEDLAGVALLIQQFEKHGGVLVIVGIEQGLDLEVDLVNRLARYLERDVFIKTATDRKVDFSEGIDAQRLGDPGRDGIFSNREQE